MPLINRIRAASPHRPSGAWWRTLAGWVLALAASAAPAAEPLGVFVSILPQKLWVQKIGGDAVTVQVMVPPGQSPATYEPSPRQMLALAQAAAYLRVGAPFEDTWLPRIQAMHPSLRIVDTRKGIDLMPMTAATGQGGGRPDPHIWTSPPQVRQQLDNIRDALIELQPALRARFEAGHAAYAAELDALDAELRRALAGKTGRRFMVFHPAWGYLARSYGLEQVPIESEGKEPGPLALARWIEQARAEGVRVVFVQKQFSRSAAQAVARAIGGEVIELDPLAEDFVANMRQVAQALARSLR